MMNSKKSGAYSSLPGARYGNMSEPDTNTSPRYQKRLFSGDSIIPPVVVKVYYYNKF
jgi:hypothetical protein